MPRSLITRCQQSVLGLIYLGKTNGEIAALLGMAPLTVKNHVQHLLKRMDAVNRTGAIYRALELGLLEPPPLKVTVKVDKARAPAPAPLPDAADWVAFGALRLSWSLWRAEVAGQPLDLWTRDFKILHFLMKHPHRVFSRAQILDHVWEQGVYVLERCVDVHVTRLRTALEPTGHGAWIETVRGLGYQFVPRGAT